jgi:outer membrane lipoprotein-sorting protein
MSRVLNLSLKVIIMKKTLFALAFLIFSIQSHSQDAEADKILQRIKKEYDALNSICVQYTQTFTWNLAGETQTVDGTLCMKDKAKFSIDSPSQTILTDGKAVWTVNKVTHQVIVDQATENREDNPFLKEFIDRFSRDYDAKMKDPADPVYHGLTLTARTDDLFVREIDLCVDKKTFLLVKVKQVDINTNYTLYKVNSIDTQAVLHDQDFVFSLPEGYEIIDLR